MKYSELEKILREAGCYDTDKQANGHPYGIVLLQIKNSD